jgi:hypothetical protein
LLGRGGMAEVYEAVHIGLQKHVALKVMNLELARSGSARELFTAEAENAARVRHPHVVDVTDVGIIDGLPFLVMALLEGEDLSVCYARNAPMPVAAVVDVLVPIAAAVATGHACGVIHRDLKPDNIFLHREGSRIVPKLLDFGVSLAASSGGDTTARKGPRVLGTARYMSPEQARGRGAVDERTDQYALAVILYEGVTGCLPRNTPDPASMLQAVAFAGFDPPSKHAELPTGLEQVILRAMAGDAKERFASMTELATVLLPFASEPVRAFWQVELACVPRSRGGSPEQREVACVEEMGGRPHEETARAIPASGQRSPLSAEPTEIFMNATSRPRAPRRFVALATACLLALLVSALVYLPERGRDAAYERAALRPAAFEVRTLPSSAELLLDGQRVGVGHYRGRLSEDGAPHELRVEAHGFAPHVVVFREHPPPRLIELTLSRGADAPPPRAAEHNESPVRPVRVSRPALPPTARRVSGKAAPTIGESAEHRQASSGAAQVPAVVDGASASVRTAGADTMNAQESGEVPVAAVAEPDIDAVVSHPIAVMAPAEPPSLRPRIRIIDEPTPKVRLVD